MASKKEELEFAIVIAVDAALKSLTQLDAGTDKFEKTLLEVNNLVKVFSKEMGVSFSQAAQSIGEATGTMGLLNEALAEYAVLSANKLSGLSNKDNAAEQAKTKLDLEEASLRVAREQGLENKNNTTLINEQLKDEAAIEAKLKEQLNTGLEMLAMQQKADMLRSKQLAETASYQSSVALGPAAPTAAQRLGMDVAGIGAMPQNVSGMAEALKKLKATNPSATFTEIGNAMRKAGADSEIVAAGLNKVKPAAENAGKGFSVLRSAMGFLTAMAMAQISSMIMSFFSNALKIAKEFRGKMAQLNFAESILSKKGMDITREELDGFVNDVVNKLKYVSKVDATDIVASVSQMSAEFKLAKKDVLGLSEAIAFMQLSERSFGEEISNGTSIVNAALDGRSNYFNKYGINITKASIKEKVYAMGLAESGQAITKEMSNQAAIAILIEQTTGKTDELIAAIEKTNPALAKQIEAEMVAQEATLAFGNEVLSLTDAWNNFLLSLVGADGQLTDIGKSAKVLVGVIKVLAFVLALVWKILMTTGGVVAAVWTPIIISIKAVTDSIKYLLAGDFVNASKALIDPMSQIGESMKQAFLDGWNRGGDPTEFLNFETSPNAGTDTPTGLGDNGEGGDPEDDKRQEALDKYAQELVETEIKAAQEREDIAIELGRDLEDIESEFGKKRVDANNEYLNDILDINNSYNEEINDIKEEQFQLEQEYRNDDLKRERDYQNKLLEMKEEYLTNLEDALHTRDAGQVLRLMRDYELEKTQAARNYELDKLDAEAQKQQDQKELQHKVEQAKRTRDIALAAAAKERDDKLAQLALEEKEEIAQAKLKAERKLEDLQKSNSDKMALLAANLAQEYKLSGAWVERMTKLYLKYYKDVGQIYANIAKMKQMAEMAAGTVGAVRPVGTPTQSNQILTKPTKTQSLDKSLPLSRLGKGVGGSSLAGGAGSLNKISIELLLSPDLESRIISSTLDQTAEVFTQVQRGR